MATEGGSSVALDTVAAQQGTVLRILLLVMGVAACSSAVIMIKASTVHPITLASFRLFVAGTVLLPLMVRDARAMGWGQWFTGAKKAVVPGILLGLHFTTWNMGARMTFAANASLVVNMVPVVMPLLLFILFRENLSPREVVGTLFAVSGVLVLGMGSFHFSRQTFFGDLVCFGSMLLFALYLALARGNIRSARLWSYIVPLYLTGGVFCLIMSFTVTSPFQAYSARNIIYIVGLGLVPTVLGHSILNYSMSSLRGQVVSIVNLGQFMFAGAFAYVFLHESPGWNFYPAAGLVLTGALIAIRSSSEKKKTSEE